MLYERKKDMFIARENEINELEAKYQTGNFEFVIIYGRRRIGKTRLIEEFTKDKECIFFSAMKDGSRNESLIQLSKCISGSEGDDFPIFPSFQSAFHKIAGMALDRRIVFVIDEFPYLEDNDGYFSSLLQNTIDREFKKTKLFLIISGSAVSFMEDSVLGYNNPLYGRCTLIQRLQNFDYYDTARWFPNYSSYEKAILYGVTGGVPYYLEQFSPELSLKDNLKLNFFNGNSVLFNEVENLLKEELREPGTYKEIISAIANGKTKYTEIADACKIKSGALNKYLKTLIELKIISRKMPMGGDEKKAIYHVSDLYFRFWFFFVPRNYSAILSRRIQNAFDVAVWRLINDYMGKVFVMISREFLEYRDKDLPILPADVGSWWGGNPKTKKECEIDVVMKSATDNRVVLGSCKFTNSPIGIDELKLMEEYADAMGTKGKRYYYFFSLSGFSENLVASSSDTIRLIDIDTLYDSIDQEPRGHEPN